MAEKYDTPPANAEPPYDEPGVTRDDRPVTNAAPDPVGVYDRPERTGGTSTLVIGVIAVLVLVLLAVLLFMFIL